MPNPKIAIATGNQHKVEEISAILTPLGIEAVGVEGFGGMPDVIEDGETFEANSAKKATEVASALQVPVMADDSGLEVDALHGAPGVYSARYAGENASDRDNLEKLLVNLAGITDRRARFVCVISLADKQGGLVGQVRGEVPGRIIDRPRGGGGFGYDPVFVPDGFRETFAELSGEIKNTLSHRGEALKKLVAGDLLEKTLNCK